MSNDVRQRKIVTMRLGTITDLPRQAQEYQAFMLKEYAEALWRRRRPDSNFAGYIPFGQYTWFQHPFQKAPDGLKPKMIWDTFREVLGPVHVQLECFDRHIFAGNGHRRPCGNRNLRTGEYDVPRRRPFPGAPDRIGAGKSQ